MRAGVLLACLLALAARADAQVFRCPGPDGEIRFSDAAARCPGAERHRPQGAIQRVDSGDPAAPRERPAPGAAGREALQAVFVPVERLPETWEIVGEAPVNVASDPQLVTLGVSAVDTWHYTRPLPGGSQVCSAEIWAFSSADAARRAARVVDYPGWRFLRQSHLLIMLRGTTFQRGEGFRKGLFPECHHIGERIGARAAQAGRREAEASRPER
jgi:hypothetical protein